MRDNIIIRPICRENCEQVARLHKTNIQVGFLSILGVSFIKLIYQSMVDSDTAFCIVAEDNKNIVGFISGAVNLSPFFKKFIKRNFLKANILLFPKLMKPENIRKIFNILFYPNKTSGLPDAEFLSLVVDERYRVKGLARILINELIKNFKERGINRFKQLVTSKLTLYDKFYEIMGAQFHSEITVYKGEKWRVYIWEI